MSKLKEYLNIPLPVQPYLLRYFNQQDPIIIFDIGACEGEDSIRYATLFPNAKIYSFEPLPTNFAKASANIKSFEIKSVQLHNLALSDNNGKADFYTSSGHPESLENNDEWNYGNKSSSLLQPGKVKEVFKWLEFKEITQVETRKLETFCEQHSITKIDYIHMDVQGAELLVLKGAGDMLNKVNSIWLEVEKIELYKNQPLKDEVNLFLVSNGFVAVFENLDHAAGDMFFVRKEMLTEQQLSVEPSKNSSMNIDWRNKFKSLLGMNMNNAQLSYSQSGEDVIINYIFQCIGIPQPSYIDIGAHHPFRLSNTALFYAKGSRGINIEPDPVLFKEFVKHRKEDVNLNIGVGGKADELDFFRMSTPTMNTFSKKEAEDLVQRFNFRIEQVKKIKVMTIDEIIKQNHKGVFPDLLTLDVEGLDEAILHSIDFSKSIPAVICVETISFETDGSGVKNKQIIQFLESKGYMVYADTYINTIFVQRDLWIKKK